MLSAPGNAATALQMSLEALTAAGTVIAAGFAAWSAWIARGAARAAEATVEEARKARKAQLAPRLVLERNFLDFHLQWPHPGSSDGQAAYLARRHWRDQDPSVPTFSLTNHGESPALEIQIVFDLSDTNGELEVPDLFKPLGLSTWNQPATEGNPKYTTLQFAGKDGSGGGIPMYRRWTIDIPNCAPGQVRTVDFPTWLLARLFLRGLQYWVRRGQKNELKPMILTVDIIAYDIDGGRHSTKSRFEAFPFWQGQNNPLIVNGHFRELPMFDTGPHARIA